MDGTVLGLLGGKHFVIEAKGFNNQTWLDRSGNYHTENLKVTERYVSTQ